MRGRSEGPPRAAAHSLGSSRPPALSLRSSPRFRRFVRHMAPHRKKGKAKGAKQVLVTDTHMPLLKKPLEHIGKQIDVPGSFWEGRMSEAEKSTLYKCTIREFTVMHAFSPTRKGQAFQFCRRWARPVQAVWSWAMRVARCFGRSVRSCS